MKCKAKFKFNGGNPVMLCSHCSTIIKYSNVFTEDEWLAAKGEKKIPGQLCDACEEKRLYNDENDILNEVQRLRLLSSQLEEKLEKSNDSDLEKFYFNIENQIDRLADLYYELD